MQLHNTNNLTKSDQAYNVIKETILLNSAKRGDPLPLSEVDFASKLGMSRTPVREALKKLEKEGIIYSYGKRGYFIKIPSIDELIEFFQVRLLLEPFAAKIATTKIDLNEVIKYKKLFQNSIDLKKDGNFLKSAKDFHLYILHNIDNSALREILINIYEKLEIGRTFTFNIRGEKSIRELICIAEAYLEQDEDLVYKNMHNHLYNAFTTFQAHVNGHEEVSHF